MERCLTVLEEIKQFSESEETSLTLTLEGLSPMERKQIYDTIEDNYEGKLQYEKSNKSHNKRKQVMLIVTKFTGEKQTTIAPAIAADVAIHHFQRYTKLSLPLCKHQFIDYYLDCLDPYTNCRVLFSHLLQDIEAHETIYALNRRIEGIVDKIVKYLKEHPSSKIFKNNTYAEEMNLLNSSKLVYKNKCDLYTKANDNKLFISVDIRKANYTIIKHYHPDIFQNLPTWEDFLLSFCGDKPIQILKLSKPIRERIFGQAGFETKLSILQEYFIRKILHDMNIPHENFMKIYTDEIILTYDPETYHRLFNRYHGTFYRVDAIRIVKLPKYDYYVKEFFQPSSSETEDEQIVITNREMKCMPTHFLMQCIKQYEGKPVLELDRKFSLDTGDVATFDEPIF